ncbi:unnamed protein product [Adineta ricciae]|uniref:DNA ligase ATP-dependent N-terminal domain-containing protein n=1 Tax=Adineta ricciae TaxID=249248 RepID=A0A814Q2P0_ADIRI|nr:unnamed protein product [Adineta ricciae]
MSNTKKTSQPSIASFFTKKGQAPVISPKKEAIKSPITVKNEAPINSPSSDSEDKIIPAKRAKKRVLSFDESNSSTENAKESPVKAVKQIKITDTKAEVKEEIQTIVPKVEQPTTTNVPLEQKSVADPQSYNPGKTNYDPVNDACWKIGESVPYSALSATLLLIEDTSARLEIIRILSNFFRSVRSLSANDLVYSVYLCVNKVAPEYDGIELGIGETIIIKAIADSTGRTMDQVKADYKSKGDLGLVAEVKFNIAKYLIVTGLFSDISFNATNDV